MQLSFRGLYEVMGTVEFLPGMNVSVSSTQTMLNTAAIFV